MEKVEQETNKNFVSSLLGTLGDLMDAGRNLYMGKKPPTYVMTKNEFCNLPGALITHPSKSVENPHYMFAYWLYQDIIRNTLSLEKSGNLRTDAAEVKRCSSMHMYEHHQLSACIMYAQPLHSEEPAGCGGVRAGCLRRPRARNAHS